MQKVHKLIQPYLNNDYQYGMKIISITGYEIDEDRGRISVDTNEKPKHFDWTIDDLPDHLRQFQKVKKQSEVATVSQADVLIASSANADSLISVLMDNIDKVQSNPEYIKQATAINNNVNSIINIKKMQLDFVKAASRMK